LSEQLGSPDPLQTPAISYDFSCITPGDGYISPQQLLLVSDFEASLSPATTAPSDPASNTPFFDSPNSKTDPSSSRPPITTNDSPPPTTKVSCARCVFSADDENALADHVISSHHVSRSGPFTCGSSGGSCNSTLRDKRTLERHLKIFHFGAVYLCRCGRGDRKDVHIRHIHMSPQPLAEPHTCTCGNRTDSTRVDALDEHEAHIKECGKRRRGRPSKKPAT